MTLRFVNVERIVIAHLKASPGIGSHRVGTDKPSPLDSTTLPFIQVIASGGGAVNQVTAGPRVDIEVLATTRGMMWDLTDVVHNAMQALGGNVARGQLVDAVVNLQLPSFVAWSPTVPRSVAVYELQLRPAPVQA